MKRFMLRIGLTADPKDVLRQVASVSPGRPFNIDEMRSRVRILDAIDRANATAIELEDQDYAVLKAALLSFPFHGVDWAILKIADDVLAADKA